MDTWIHPYHHVISPIQQKVIAYSRSERLAGKILQHVKAFAKLTDNTTIYQNSSGDDGNDKPHSKSLQLKSRCHQDDEITPTEDKKVGLSLIQMTKDLLGLSSADNTSRSNKNEPITQEAEHDDSLDTCLFYELPDGTQLMLVSLQEKCFTTVSKETPSR